MDSPLGVRKGAWTEEEDLLLRKCVEKYGEGKWHEVPQKAGLNRCRKSCRLRWLNYLHPNIKRGGFTEDEVDLIIRLHKLLGNRWALIAGRLPGRTANDIKNYWNSHLSKKLAAHDKKLKPKPEMVKVIRPQARTLIPRSIQLNGLQASGSQQQPQQQEVEHCMPKTLDEHTMWWNNLILDGEEMNQRLCIDVDMEKRCLSSTNSKRGDIEALGEKRGSFLDGGGQWDDLLDIFGVWNET